MTYYALAGSFTTAGTSPDGDTIRFQPDHPENVTALKGAQPVAPATGLSIPEAIDGLHLDYEHLHERRAATAPTTTVAVARRRARMSDRTTGGRDLLRCKVDPMTVAFVPPARAMTTSLSHTPWFELFGASPWIRDASGWISDASAWIRDASGWISDASGWIRDASTRIPDASACMRRGSRIVKLYSKRFTIEETFRDQKDIHFGMGLSATHINNADRRDRLMLLAAVAQTLLTLLGAASEASGLDRYLKTNTSKKRQMSLLRQGLYWYECIPTMREEWLRPLMDAFDRIVREQRFFQQVFGVI